MTDYNDGKWHGWNGGECPVHDESIVQVSTPYGWCSERAANWYWDDKETQIAAFRVVKEYREPREFWITLYDGMAWDTSAHAEQHRANILPDGGSQIIHVREVLG